VEWVQTDKVVLVVAVVKINLILEAMEMNLQQVHLKDSLVGKEESPLVQTQDQQVVAEEPEVLEALDKVMLVDLVVQEFQHQLQAHL
tara:strand:+ start:379 stop:639 length:261 start_codon:yes stop_codon:yes gene_type:complete